MKSLIVALSLSVAALSAIASEATVFEDNFVSTKTRAEVRAEVLAARAAGTLIISGEATEFAKPTGAPVSRAQVIAERQRVLDKGHAFFGEASPYAYN